MKHEVYVCVHGTQIADQSMMRLQCNEIYRCLVPKHIQRIKDRLLNIVQPRTLHKIVRLYWKKNNFYV